MRVEVVDPSGLGLGLAIGLLELGHDVHYTPCCSPRDQGSCVGEMRRELIDHMFGNGQPSVADPDLLVLIDVSADLLRCLARGEDASDTAVTHPLQDDAGVLVYPSRLHYFVERAQAAPRVAVIDMSDVHGPRECAFEALPHVQLFAREVHGSREGAWQSFPFLYNLAMLWLEYLRPTTEWLVEKDRPQQWDWAFCGTIAHERYARKREAAIAVLASRWPELRGTVISQVSFRDVLGILQSIRFGLDLQGAGQLCFRLHECLALGTPVWQPLPSDLHLPAGLSSVLFADPANAPSTDVASVRAIYAQHYGPAAAATWLLQRLDEAAHQYSMYQATNIAAPASR